MREILGKTYDTAMRDVNTNIVVEDANHRLIWNDVITSDQFHDDMDRLIFERDSLIVEISERILERVLDPRVQPLLALASEALVREAHFRNIPGYSFDLPFVQKFFGALVDVRSN